VGNRGVLGRLGTGLGLFTIAIDVVVNGAIQAKSTKLHCSAVNLVAVPRHANSLKLIKDAPRMEGCASRRLGCGGGSAGLVLLLRSRQRCGCRAGGHTARVPGISTFARGSFCLGRMRVICDLDKVRFGELILGRR
jgi:hypothetical protein